MLEDYLQFRYLVYFSFFLLEIKISYGKLKKKLEKEFQPKKNGPFANTNNFNKLTENKTYK